MTSPAGLRAQLGHLTHGKVSHTMSPFFINENLQC